MLLSALYTLYLSFYFLRLHEYRPETAESDILFLTLAICLLIYLFKREKNLSVIQTTMLVGLFCAAIMSHVTQFYLQGVINTADELLRLFVLYFISASLFIDKFRLKYYFKIFSICALVIAVHGINQFHGGGIGWTGESLYLNRVRYIGVFNDPNDMGMLLLVSLPFILYTIKQYKFILPKLIWASTLPLLLYAIYLTGSRGTMLGLLLMVAVNAWFKFKRVVSLFLIAITVPIAFSLTQLSTISSGDASSAGRIDAWGSGIQMLKSNPLFGVGYGLFTVHHPIPAHNSYVQVFSEIGLVGYFFWLGFLAMSMYGLYKFSYKFNISNEKSELYLEHKSVATTVLFSLLGFAITSYFISRSVQPLLFILCAMSAGVYYQIRKNFPEFEMLRLSNSYRICAFLVVCSILFVYASIRAFW
ncbi:MAG: hypothetical protein GKR92_07040 [Gammaproteobacteria bacterium]|nr:MAG: hypothetical protein GKR92_07040 [Gammaproteobacteria bacterium]